MIKGFRPTSLVDFPGKISSVLFTYGCNFRCPYCYNVELIVPEKYSKLKDLDWEDILNELTRRKGFIKGVVITGGEPTIWKEELINLIKEIYYKCGLPIKLDTNGSNPEVIKELWDSQLISFLALDFKTAPERYPELGGNFNKIEKTLEIISSDPDKVEIRITFYPPLVSEKELKEMVPYLKKFKFIAFQKYIPGKTLENKAVAPYSLDFYQRAILLFKDHLPEVEIVERF